MHVHVRANDGEEEAWWCRWFAASADPSDPLEEQNRYQHCSYRFPLHLEIKYSASVWCAAATREEIQIYLDRCFFYKPCNRTPPIAPSVNAAALTDDLSGCSGFALCSGESSDINATDTWGKRSKRRWKSWSERSRRRINSAWAHISNMKRA